MLVARQCGIIRPGRRGKWNVTDNSGEPVIGATVTVVGGQGNAGTVTDIDGNFTVQVQSGSKLSISFMGYKTQVVKAAKGLRIVLEEDAKLLNEVVVTGYTTQRKADLTGAISVVSVDEIAKQNENNPIKALQGRVPGMNITAEVLLQELPPYVFVVSVR